MTDAIASPTRRTADAITAGSIPNPVNPKDASAAAVFAIVATVIHPT